MSSYVSYGEYTTLGYNTLPSSEAVKYLNDASRAADSLTFNRIVAIGFDDLTAFQKGIVQEFVCRQADFLFNNADAIASVLAGYSINGVSMQFGAGLNFTVEGGVPVQADNLALLRQTGLTWRAAI